MAKRVIGKALYMELHRGSNTAQVIITPPVHNPVTDTRQKSVTMTRSTDPSVQRRAWRFYTSKVDVAVEQNADLSLLSVMDLIAPIAQEVGSLLAGYQTGGWMMYKKPLVVEMTTDDFMDISELKTPQALVRRIMRAREVGGYSESLYAGLTTEPSAGYTPTTTGTYVPVSSLI